MIDFKHDYKTDSMISGILESEKPRRRSALVDVKRSSDLIKNMSNVNERIEALSNQEYDASFSLDKFVNKNMVISEG